MTRDEFYLFLHDYKEHVREKFFPFIPKTNWHLLSDGENSFTIRTNVSQLHAPPHEQALTLIFKHQPKLNAVHVIFTRIYGGNAEQMKMKHIYEDFKDYLNKHQKDMLVILDYWSSFLLNFKRTNKLPYFIEAVGDSSTHLLHLLNEIEYVRFTNDFEPYLYFPKKYTHFPITLHLDEKKLTIQIDDHFVDVSSTEDVKRVLSDINAIKETLQKEEETLVNYAKTFTDNVYYDQKNGCLYIYNKQLPMYFSKTLSRKNTRFRLRIGSSYYVNKNIEPLIQKGKEKIDAFVKKNRIKTAISGEASDLFGKFLYTVLGRQVRRYTVCNLLQTSLDEISLKNHIHAYKDSLEKKILPKEYLDFMQMVFRSNKSRIKIKEAFEVANLFIFTSSKKVFIYTKDEFFSLSIGKDFKKKEDLLLASKLNRWLEKQIS